jgi:hypothetical protein
MWHQIGSRYRWPVVGMSHYHVDVNPMNFFLRKLPVCSEELLLLWRGEIGLAS